jgi:taurine dioxygenase
VSAAVRRGLELVPLPGGVGSEILGIDLHSTGTLDAAWSREDTDRLRVELDRTHMLVWRGSPLSGEEQLAFTGRFGPLLAERQPWGHVSNVRPDGIVREGALLHHSDFAFTPWPVWVICLNALEVPDDGAPTTFADAVRAARALPAALRARLRDAEVLNVYDFATPQSRRMRVATSDPRAPRCTVPVLGRHPRTGEEVIVANEMHSDAIVGLPPAESEAVLADLFAVLYDPAHLVEHRWQVGDVVLWDNVALHHGRPDFPVEQARTLRRVVVGPYTPSELVPDLPELIAAARGA